MVRHTHGCSMLTVARVCMDGKTHPWFIMLQAVHGDCSVEMCMATVIKLVTTQVYLHGIEALLVFC